MSGGSCDGVHRGHGSLDWTAKGEGGGCLHGRVGRCLAADTAGWAAKNGGILLLLLVMDMVGRLLIEAVKRATRRADRAIRGRRLRVT